MNKIKKIIVKILIIISLTSICFVWAYKMPFKYGTDEKMKMDICQYIYKNSTLPDARDAAIRDENWGISYAFTPIFDYMVSGVTMKIVSNISTTDHALLVAARFPSVLSYMGFSIMIMLISKKLFKEKSTRFIFFALTACLPQIFFLGSYINNDCFAMFCTALIVYAWLLGIETKWSIKSCIILGVGVGLCALSYYNAYGYILTSAILFIVTFMKKQKESFLKKEFWKKGILIFIIAFALAGWWFIRNYILYDGDFLGLTTTETYGEKYGVDTYKPSRRMTPSQRGENLKEMLFLDRWVVFTTKSFIAVFGNMSVIFNKPYYLCYLAFYSLGIIGLIIGYFEKVIKSKKIFAISILQGALILNIIIPIGLSLYYSFFSDFQPQGRYIMPILIPIMYFISKGIEHLSKKIIKDEKFRYYIVITIAIIIAIAGVESVLIRII